VLGGKNAEIVNSHLEFVVNVVYDRICKLFNNGYVEGETPEMLVLEDLSDPVRVFIKDEPHSQKKLSEGFYRLISNVSLVDQVIDRLIFGPQNRLEIQSHRSIPVKPGMGLHDDGLRDIYNNVQECPTDLVASADGEGWDYQVREIEMEAFGLKTINCYGLPPGSLGEVLIRNRVKILSRKLFVLSNGTLIAQRNYGIMASGAYITSSANSYIAVLLAFMTGAVWAMAMGDDLLRTPVDNATARYKELGHKLKFYEETPRSQFEFCSTQFSGSPLGEPKNSAKTMYRLLSHSGTLEERETLFRQFKYEMRNHTQFPDLEQAVIDSGFLKDSPVTDLCTEGIEPNPGPFSRVQRVLCSFILLYWVLWCKYPKTVSVLIKMPRDCTAITKFWLPLDVQSPRRLWVSNTMPRKRNSKGKLPPPVPKKPQKLQAKRAPQTPKVPLVNLFGNMLRGGGAMAGRFLGGNPGADYGHSLGDSISKWLGTGDYSVARNAITERVAKGSPAIPMMHGSGQSIIVRHKEYIGDIVSAPTANTFLCSSGIPLNPGLSSSFPWLSTIAQQFQEYTWRGIVFHFESTSGDSVGSVTTSLGTVMMGTQYKATAPPFQSKQIMLNEYFSCDAKPSVDFCHPIECDPNENPYNVQYIRGAAVPAGEDPKTYDLGTFYYATTGMQGTNVSLGELWVTYEVELRKPIISGDTNVYGDFAHFFGTGGITNALPFGNAVSTKGSTSFLTAPTGTLLTFPPGTDGLYLITYTVACTSSTGGTSTVVNCTKPGNFISTNSNFVSNAVNTTYQEYVRITDSTVTATWALTFTTLVAGTAFDLTITQLPQGAY